MTALLRLMTASRARSARACRRRHYLQYVLGYRPAEDAHALRFGTLLHIGLEAWWKAIQNGIPQEQWLAAAQAAVLEQRDVAEIDRCKLQVLFTGYHLRWMNEDYEVLGVELKFEGPLLNPATGRASQNWRLAGKLDVLVRCRVTGRILIIEHKSSSEDVSPSADYWRRLRMDSQVSVYFEGARILGHTVDACLYDVVGKFRHDFIAVPLLDEHGNKIVHDSKGERVRTGAGKWRQTGDAVQGFVLQTRPETVEEFQARLAGVLAETPDKYFARGEVNRLEEDLRGAMTDVWQLAQQLREEEISERFPRNPDACMPPGRTCPFFSVCAGEASIEDQRLFTRNDNVHPELAEADVHQASDSKEEFQ